MKKKKAVSALSACLVLNGTKTGLAGCQKADKTSKELEALALMLRIWMPYFKNGEYEDPGKTIRIIKSGGGGEMQAIEQ